MYILFETNAQRFAHKGVVRTLVACNHGVLAGALDQVECVSDFLHRLAIAKNLVAVGILNGVPFEVAFLVAHEWAIEIPDHRQKPDSVILSVIVAAHADFHIVFAFERSAYKRI